MKTVRRICNTLKPSNIILFFVGFVVMLATNKMVDVAFEFSADLPMNEQHLQAIQSEQKILSTKGESVFSPIPFNNETRSVWIVTSTTYGLSQPPRLVRIAQALFPVRHFVNWVVVQQSSTHCRNLREHIESLQRFLQRFDIPYIILAAKDDTGRTFDDRLVKTNVNAKLTGLNWILKNAGLGVLMFAPENFVYDHRIFHEIRHTKTVSVWPVGLKRKFGLTSPLVSKNGVVTGYFNGMKGFVGHSNQDFFLELGGYSLNLNFVNLRMSRNNRRELIDQVNPSLALMGISLSQVTPLAEKCSKIYVWRTVTREHSWPKDIMLNQTFKGTNVELLMKKIYGGRFSEIVVSTWR